MSRGTKAIAAAAAVFALSGCAGNKTVAARLVAAATQARMQPVVACWEKEFESTGFESGYVATVDFEIDGDSRIHDAHVTDLSTVSGAAPGDQGAFRACVESALNTITLPTEPDGDGPGFHVTFGAAVRGYRIEFLDASAERRKRAAGRQANVLIGPRADRCQGLYTYDPPRDSSLLYGEISVGVSRAEAARDRDPSSYAREMQRTYDLQLELAQRLEADLAAPNLPEANRKRLRTVLEGARKDAKRTGAVIGCAPSSAAR
ncbi:hypothetical protein [Polyangium aurulentum]|uniref:hypothetical protein n=1 Tax=Polyangium aurulentum TaxID=2567896 RepID=UPI0010ADF4B6|nr:hypothetical protein [Polyangium aurulentum]UQA54702.1 hypothetical protein E8A73_025355 [Polyangium aurulentum]